MVVFALKLLPLHILLYFIQNYSAVSNIGTMFQHAGHGGQSCLQQIKFLYIHCIMYNSKLTEVI